MKEIKVTICIIILMLFAVIGCGVLLIVASFVPSDICEFEISELSDGIYVYYEDVIAKVPEGGYTIVTICDTNGSIYTIKGRMSTLNIKYGEKPYAIWEKSRIGNHNKVTIYAPTSTIRYLGATWMK